MKKFFYLMLLLAVPAFMTSCEKDDDEEIVTPQEEPEQPGGEQEQSDIYSFIKLPADWTMTEEDVEKYTKSIVKWDRKECIETSYEAAWWQYYKNGKWQIDYYFDYDSEQTHRLSGASITYYTADDKSFNQMNYDVQKAYNCTLKLESAGYADNAPSEYMESYTTEVTINGIDTKIRTLRIFDTKNHIDDSMYYSLDKKEIW